MTDRELLEKAAIAAGFEVNAHHQAARDACGAGDIGLWVIDVSTCWNPLTDDGDEARLETVLGLDVVWHSECVFVGRKLHRNGSAVYAEEFANHGGDKRAARRRAGVRAAAAMAPESDARDPGVQS